MSSTLELDADDDFDTERPTFVDQFDRISVPLVQHTLRNRALLTVLTGPERGTVHRLPAGEITIGRSGESVITIADHGLSRIHARLRAVPGGFILTDGGSTNGSFIDDQRISAPTMISPGSRFRLGTRTLVSLTLHDELEETAALSVHQAALRDRLTGAYNRGVFDDRLRSELAFTKRHQTPLSLVLFDIDFFKTFNDKHGHQVGDAVLIAVADQVQTTVRTEDTLARYGGEEFVVIARDTSKEKSRILAERIRVAVESCLVEGSGTPLSVTVSLGVATASDETHGYDAVALISAADKALYEAKRSGRNCIRHSDDLVL